MDESYRKKFKKFYGASTPVENIVKLFFFKISWSGKSFFYFTQVEAN
jgi:hypothetical protein